MRDVTGTFAHLLGAAPRACRVCGCTEHDACLHPSGRACSWVGPNLCSVCANTIAELMREIDISDRAAEQHLKVLLLIESARTGLTPPEFRRRAHAHAAKLH